MNTRFGWLEPATASEGADIMENYFAMDYRLERSPEGLKIHCWNFSRPVTFILRSRKGIVSVQGGRVQKVQDDAYVLTVEQPEFAVEWAGEQQ